MTDTNEQPTPVLFRVLEKEVIALFPTLPGTNDVHTCLSYMHLGQHGSASVDLIASTRPATPLLYGPLADELRQIGYVLDIRKRMTRRHHAARRASLR